MLRKKGDPRWWQSNLNDGESRSSCGAAWDRPNPPNYHSLSRGQKQNWRHNRKRSQKREKPEEIGVRSDKLATKAEDMGIPRSLTFRTSNKDEQEMFSVLNGQGGRVLACKGSPLEKVFSLIVGSRGASGYIQGGVTLPNRCTDLMRPAEIGTEVRVRVTRLQEQTAAAECRRIEQLSRKSGQGQVMDDMARMLC